MLAALSAGVWGVADFSGGKASQRANPLLVTVASQVLSIPVLLVCLLLVPGTPNAEDMLWGAVAGVAGLFGIVLLYRALSAGAMAVVAPTTAVTAAVVPLIVGLIVDASPGGLAIAGMVCAIVSIALVSLGPSDGGKVTTRLIGIALLAGAMFGVFFSLLGRASEEAGMWPLIAVRAASIGAGVIWLFAGTRPSLRMPRVALAWAVPAGTLDIIANALFMAAAARGHLSVVAALASLYPASTVLLALAVDRERLRAVQVAGLGLAATALILASS